MRGFRFHIDRHQIVDRLLMWAFLFLCLFGMAALFGPRGRMDELAFCLVMAAVVLPVTLVALGVLRDFLVALCRVLLIRPADGDPRFTAVEADAGAPAGSARLPSGHS